MSVIFDSASHLAKVSKANLGAEVRAVESGRNVRWNQDTGRFVVLSDDGHRTYSVTVSAVGDLLRMSCTCKAGRLGAQRPAGEIGCRHRGACARRLERMGWASFGVDGLWHVTDRALVAASAL